MAVKSVFPHCVRTIHILPNLVTYESADGDHSCLQLIVPATHHNDILQALHARVAGGHLG